MKSETNTPEKRLRILGDDEIEALYGRPRFTDEERVQAFALAQEERALLQELRSLRSQTYFILQLGYFKAKRLFFMFDLQETAEDVQYIRGQYFPDERIDDLSALNKRTIFNQRRLILDLYHYRSCDEEERQNIEHKARQAARVSSKPIYVFRELMQLFDRATDCRPWLQLYANDSG